MDRQVDVQALLASLGIVPRRNVPRSTFRRPPRRVKTGVSTLCSKCGGPRDRAEQAYCRSCHAAYARAHRPKHSELAPEARRRANCRRLTGMLVARGKMAKTPCACGATDHVTAVHHDYDDAWAVTWTCQACRRGRRRAVAA
jgi:hypothetical protein